MSTEVVKRCTSCRKQKPLDDFHRDRRRKDERRSRCRDCDTAGARRYRLANRAKERERRRRWMAAHPEKEREYADRQREKAKAARKAAPHSRPPHSHTRKRPRG